MKSMDIIRAIGGIDPRFIADAAPGNKSVYIKYMRMRAFVLAACITLAFAILLTSMLVPFAYKRTDGFKVPARVSLVDAKTYLFDNITIEEEDDYVSENSNAIIARTHGFFIHTVIEAELIEVLPDDYDGKSVMKLRVIDEIRAENMPEIIYVSYKNQGNDAFVGCDSFILSLDQVGIENYVLLNRTKGVLEYFDNMFVIAHSVVSTGGMLGGGNVIAFKDGVLYTDFWERTIGLSTENTEVAVDMRNYINGEKFLDLTDGAVKNYTYPALIGDDIETVKKRITEYSDTSRFTHNSHIKESRYDYLTADDFFITDEARALQEKFKPEGCSVFYHNLILLPTESKLIYKRLINGSVCDEVYGLYLNGETLKSIKYPEKKCNEEQLQRVPDIKKALSKINLERFEPYTYNKDAVKVIKRTADGEYRLDKDGNLYGVIIVTLYFRTISQNEKILSERVYDESFIYVYDLEGNVKSLDRNTYYELFIK